MPHRHTVTDWIEQLKAGETAAAQRLWERYFPELLELARRRLRNVRLRVATEEDIANSAIARFCERARAGKFPDLEDRHGLWRLLLTITLHKTIDRIRRNELENQTVTPESALTGADSEADADNTLDQLAIDDHTPDVAVVMADEISRLLDLLHEDRLQSMAVDKMDGLTNGEIARKYHCAVSTVERSLRVIRDVWKEERPG